MLAQTKTTDGMHYEAAGKKEISNASEVNRKIYRKAVERHSTAYTLWILVLKHKVPLLVLGNVILVLNWAFPEWFQLVLSLIGK